MTIFIIVASPVCVFAVGGLFCAFGLFSRIIRGHSQGAGSGEKLATNITYYIYRQCPNVWLKFLMPGDNTKNSVKSIDSLACAELQSSRWSMIHAHMLIEIKHYTKVHLDVDKLRAYMESVMGHHIHVDNKIPGSGKEDLDQIKAYIQKEETA